MREKSLFTVLLLENSSWTGTKSWENRTMQEETSKKKIRERRNYSKKSRKFNNKTLLISMTFCMYRKNYFDENYFPFSSDWRGRPSIVRGNLKYFFLSPLKQLSESNTEQVCDVDSVMSSRLKTDTNLRCSMSEVNGRRWNILLRRYWIFHFRRFFFSRKFIRLEANEQMLRSGLIFNPPNREREVPVCCCVVCCLFDFKTFLSRFIFIRHASRKRALGMQMWRREWNFFQGFVSLLK